MDRNPEGTPNPLNPMPDVASAANQPQPGEETAAGAGTIGRTESVMPASFAQSSGSATITGMAAEPSESKDELPTEPALSTPEANEPVTSESEANEPALNEPTLDAPEAETPTGLVAEPVGTTAEEKPEPAAPRFVAPRPMPKRGGAVDPMMRRVAKPQPEKSDSLEMSEETIAELRAPEVTPAPQENNQDFVAKDSIVESAGKSGKKKVFVVCGIILLMIAVICGAAAIAVMITNNNSGDRVSKAIEKLLNGNVSTIVSAQGKIATTAERLVATDTVETTTETAETTETTEPTNGVEVTDTSVSVGVFPFITNTSIDFNGTFDFSSPMNKLTATVTSKDENGNEFTIDVDELETKSGDVYFKLGGLSDLVNNSAAGSLLSIYKGLFETIDDEWILASGSVENAAESLSIFDNNSTCLINAFGTLPQYAKDIVNKYKANQFITYSTNNLKISKKKNDLYRLSIDNEKMSAFVNSLGNNGFINELNACAGDSATNTAITSGTIKGIFENFPTMYVEVDENYNFTRVYFEAKNDTETISSTVKADINLSYPSELKVTEPTEYLNMSTLLSNVMTNFYSSNTAVPVVEGTANSLPESF